jgi:hypothetical protein
MSTYKYVDSALGSGNNDGTSEANAWRGVDAIKTGMETNHAADTVVVYRRTSVFDIGAGSTAADIGPTDDGTAAIPCYHIGMPRAAIPNTTITGADFTNGSRLVDNVAGITPGLRAHGARWITAPDGKKYLITAVLWEFTIDGMAAGAEFELADKLTNTTANPDRYGKVWKFTDNLNTTGLIQAAVDSAVAWVDNDNITSNTGGDAELSANATAVGFLIDREYAGSTVTGTSGKFQIEADEDYAAFHAAGVGASWEADAHDLPKIDFNDGAYQLVLSSDYYFSFRNFYFEDSDDTLGIIRATLSLFVEFIGCIIKQSVKNRMLFSATYQNVILNRFIIEGSGVGNIQNGIQLEASIVTIINGAIYNCGNYGIYELGINVTEKILNLNIGSEITNLSYDIGSLYQCYLKGRDMILGGLNGYVLFANPSKSVTIENYQKTLGINCGFYHGGSWESIAVTSTAANKKLSDTVLKIIPSINIVPSIEDWKQSVFLGVFSLASGSQTIKFWIYNNGCGTLNDTLYSDNIYLKAKYVDSYDDTSEYTQTNVYSAEIDIANAANANDWDYLQVTVNPAVASLVRVELLLAAYHATGYILVDPLRVIS